MGSIVEPSQFSNAKNTHLFYWRKSSQFLVFVRSGANCPAWLENIENIDVLVSLYDKPADWKIPYRGYAGAATGGLSKFHAFKSLADAYPELLEYAFVLFLDADITMDAASLQSAFQRGLEKRLDCFQLALSDSSYSAFPFLFQRGDAVFRQTNFVEVMAPFMSRAYLKRVLDTFDQSISTWGLDLLWSFQYRTAACGVLNDLLMHHEDYPDAHNGPFYRYLQDLGIDAELEMRGLLAQHFIWIDYPHDGPSWSFTWWGRWFWRPVAWLQRRLAKRQIKQRWRSIQQEKSQKSNPL